MTILQGKKGLIMGVANNRSIAWGIAQEAKKYGADLAFTYQGEALQKRVEPLAELEKKWGKLDFIVHAIAYSDKEELRGRFIDTTPGNFVNTMNISCYSL